MTQAAASRPLLPATKTFLPVILAVCVIGAVVVRFSPRLVVWSAWACRPDIFEQSETGRANVALWQVEHLGEAVENRDHRVQRWRLLFPVVAAVMQLPAPLHLALYPAGAILAVGYLAAVLRREEMTPWQTFAALLAVTANSWFFTATGWLAYCDGWVALGLLIVAFSRDWQAVLATSLLLPWADDRFILGVPVALAAAWVMTLDHPLRAGPSLLCRATAAGAGIVVAISLRAAFAAVAGADMNAAPIPPLGHADAMLVAGFWHNLRSAWLLIPAAIIGLALRHGVWNAAIMAVVASCCFAVPYAAAYDQSRAAVVLLPLTVIGVFELAGSTRWWPMLPAIAAANLLLPACHMMLLGFSQIDPLWTEVQRLHHPPKPYRPDDYAIAAVEQSTAGNRREADWLVEIAASLQCDPALLARTRALLALDAGEPRVAVKILRRCIASTPASVETEALLAIGLAKMGHSSEAGALAARLLAGLPADHPCRAVLEPVVRETPAQAGSSPAHD